MANGTRSSDRVKDEEITNGRLRQSGEKGITNSHSSVSDTNGVRRSMRETSSKNMTPSPSSTRKSKRLDERTPATPAVRRKSERFEKQNMPSPLGRSGRTRSHSSLSPSDSKSSESLSSKQKPEKEKSVKQLTFGDEDKNEERCLGTSQTGKKRMDARQYRSMFQKPNNGYVADHLVPNKVYKSTQKGHYNREDKIDECSKGCHFDRKEVSKNDMLPSEDDKANKMRIDSRLSGTMKSSAENNMTTVLLVPDNATTSETRVVPERVQPDSCGDDRLRMLESRKSLLDEDLVRGHDSGENLIPSKRNGTMVDMISDVSATLANDDDDNLIPSRPCGYIVETGRSCSKRKRLDCDPTVSCCNESCNPSANELQDGGDIDASMLEKECHENSQTEVAKNLCLICKSEGPQLLFCGGKGCGRCYHLSCLEPPLVDAPFAVWYCRFCVRKKIALGVYSVSEGVESVCDAKVPSSKVDGSAAQKEFLVKYKGLAYVHNQWIPENQLLLEAPSLIMNFNMKDQTQRLKPEWSLPHRLLQKRAIICSTEHDDHKINPAIDNVDCCYEWLVKWRGLGYEHATWELDNASFLRSPEGQSLIQGYEERFQRPNKISLCSKLDKKPACGNSVSKLCQMPGGVSSGVGNNNLDAVNKLREHWCQGQNAVVIDDHDRILKVVAFILSLRSDTYRPFLIISTASSLHSWEDEFYRLDPSIDVVIYSGNKEIRNSIRRLEFFDEGGCILFQVLIVAPEILIEDVDVFGGIEWEAIIVDESQSPKVSPYFEKFKILNTHLRVLLFRTQLKDSIAEYINILAFLDCQSDNEKDGLIPNSSNNIDQLKEKFSNHIAYRCKSDSFRFVEYWVPVQISHVQLEQYCATLHSNGSILRSSAKMDTVEALRQVLITTRKCCSHPYTVDQSLKSLLTKGLKEVEYLDVEIKASGKLQLLDSLLMELRKNNLRGLVLFQSIGGSGRGSIGDFLDDLLRQRFGENSYERVDKGLVLSKTKDAMRKFNKKDDGRFVFLLETSACSRSIRLSSVDTIIIFDSDWNPMNDIRSLQKITLDSQSELIKIFRLYSSFTVEENALILAKQDKTLDSSLQNISRNTSHMLLMWGASTLFDDLRVFHDGETSVSSPKSLSGEQLLKEAVHEFSSILSQDGEDNDTSNCLILSKVQPNGGTYRAGCKLLGEQKLRLLDEEPPHNFWTKLLEGKQFQWKYSHSSSSQRSRKRVNHFDGSVNKAELVTEGIVAKKRRKASNNIVEQPSSKSEGVIMAGTSGDPADRPQCNDVESEKKTSLRDEQRSLHLKLKPEITKLCEVLLLPDHVRSMVDNFLEYIVNNHHVNSEPVSILQAFQISLIWTAAALLKHKLDHKASLLQAKQHLNFDCKKEEVDYILSMLQCLKRIFLFRTESSNDTYSSKVLESSKRVCSNTLVAQEVELFGKDLNKSIKEIRKKCKKVLMKLSHMYQEEKQRLEKVFEDEKAGFERMYRLELASIRSFSPNDMMRTEKLKVLNSEHGKKIEELKLLHETRLKVLEDKQLAEMQKFKDRENTWVEDVNSWAQNELSNIVASKEHGTGVEYLQTCDQEQPQNGPKNVALVSNHFTEGKGHGNMIEDMTRTESGVPEINSPAAVLCSRPVELQTPLINHTAADEIGNMASEDRPILRKDGHDIAENQNDSLGNVITEPSHSRKQNFDGATTMADEGDGGENFSQVSRDGCGDDTATSALPSSNNAITGNSPISDERAADGDIVRILDGAAPVEMPMTVKVTDCPENVNAANPPSSVEQVLDGCALSEVLSRELSRPCGTATPSNGPDTIALLNPPSEQQVSDGVSLSVSQGDIPVILPENSHEVADSHNCTGHSTEAVLVDKSTISDQQEGVPRTVAECALSQETPVSRPVDVIEPLEQAQQLSSVEVPPDQDSAGEMQSSSEHVELVSSSVVVVPANQSNPVSLIMEPSEQGQQLPSSECPSSNQHPSNLISATGVEHQSICTDDLPHHDAEASTVVPNQDVEPDSNLELDSHSHQVVHSAADSDLHSLRPIGVRTETSNTRNLSTPSDINNRPIQTAIQSASRMLPPIYADPLKNELERIRKVTEQITKNHEDMKLRLKSDFEKELEELRRKYDVKFQEVEVEFQQTKNYLDTSFRTVFANKILADAFRSKCTDRKLSGAYGMQQDALAHQLIQLARQEGATRPSSPHIAGPSSCGPPASSLQSPPTMASSQNMLPPAQAVYNASGIFSGVHARLPLVNNSIPSSSGNFQVGGEMRAPAPHLQPYRPSTSVPALALPHGMPSRPVPSNIPATPPSFAHAPPHPHMSRHPPNNLPAMDLRANANSQSAINLPNVLSSKSDAASLNPSRFGTNGSVLASSSNQAASPDLVCLSDDD